MPTIIIIEEDEFLAGGMRDVIEIAFPYITIEMANNGLDGFQLIRKILPDLIFCDYQMPELSGLEVLAELEKPEDTVSIPFILCTASSNSDLSSFDFERDDRDILRKPFEVTELLAFIEYYIS